MKAPAFYALKAGGWNDYFNLLHPPYLIWHLSYVILGAAAAPRFHAERLGATLLAFALAVGISSHALDELKGRPLRTQVPRTHLICLASGALVAAAALGVTGAVLVDSWLLAFVGAGTVLVVTYNLEMLGGRLHNRFWFGLAWGAFPALTGYWAQAGSIGYVAGLAAAVCLALTLAQSYLSRKAKSVRRLIERPSEMDIRRLRTYEWTLCAVSIVLPTAATGILLARLVR